ncbi:unnamed protein product [Strongylus vulgaris]|uniref:Uncharacterized protein n=1 Tax=Strongylus vulgaris TaxID=40348 RepID=A0A3P7IPV6_STRVU|nr:unnamed protein product [Strongylus vulgaris]
MNMKNDLIKELNKTQRATWTVLEPLKEATDQLTDPEFRAPVRFNCSLLRSRDVSNIVGTLNALRTTPKAL